MIQQTRAMSGPARKAFLRPRTLNVLIIVCVGLIAIAYVIGSQNRTESGLGIAILAMISLGWLFAALDGLVLLRLGRPVVKAVARRIPPGASQVLFTVLALVALGVSVVSFFGATCYGLLKGF
jgi:uncharacterized membrane protein